MQTNRSNFHDNNVIEEETPEVTVGLENEDNEKAPFLGNTTTITTTTTTTTTQQTNKPNDNDFMKKSSLNEKKQRDAVLSVIFYWITSLALVFLNKAIMVGDITELDAPLFMSWTQFVVTIFCCWMLGCLGRYIKPFAFFPCFEYKIDVAKKVLPLTFVFLGMIIFNNLCLKYVEVSFYQVARSLTILFNVIFSWIFIGQTSNKNVIICCVVITIGYLLGCEGEVRFSLLGVIYGLLSSMFVALHAIYVKKILPAVDDNSEKLMIYNNMNAAIILPIIIFLSTGEWEYIQHNYDAFASGLFWAIIFVAGVMGFLINFATYLQIKFTSPLSHNISGTAKAAAQTIIALIYYGNPITIQGMLGCAIVIIGSFAYSRAK